MLVDLPGYGFAFAKEEKIQLWTSLVRFCVAVFWYALALLFCEFMPVTCEFLVTSCVHIDVC